SDIDGTINGKRTAESRLRVNKLISHGSHVSQLVKGFSHGGMRRTINSFLNGKSLLQSGDGFVILFLIRERLRQGGQVAGRLGVVIAVVGLNHIERLPVQPFSFTVITQIALDRGE